MIFSAATFLFLLPLAGLPILFHLILKQKKRTIVFSTLMFFHRVDPKMNRHRRIREWLLLLMRILVIALILLALSRPAMRLGGGSGGELSLVAIIDNSGSMSGTASEADLTKLESATEGARRLLSSLEPGTEAALVLLVEDRTANVPETMTTDRDALLACLDRIAPTEATGDAYPALSQALELLHGSAAGGGVVHVFSDLQHGEWAADARRFEDREDRVHIYLHRIGTAPQERANVSVRAVQFPSQRVLAGQPYGVGLALRNDSDSAADVRINSVDSLGEKSTQNVAFQSHQTLTVEFPVTMTEQGHHWLRTWVEGDGFAADNAACIGLFCEGMGTVLFTGQAPRFGVLPLALCPSGQGQLTGLVAEFSQSPALDQREAEDTPILVATTWDWLAAQSAGSTALAKYVEAGGNLFIVPSVSPAAATPQMPAWLEAKIRNRQAYTNGVRLQALNRDTRFWREIGQVVGDIAAEPLAAYAFHPLELSPAFTPLLGAGTERIVLAQRSLGEGNVFVSGTAFSSRWNTLPLSGLGVVLAQRIAVGGNAASDAHNLSLVAGERPRVPPDSNEIEVLSLVGDALEWKGPPDKMPTFPRTGVYLLTTDGERQCVSVRASDREGQYRFVEDSAVAMLGPMAHTVVSFEPDADYEQYHEGQARAMQLYIPLLLLMALAAVFEGFLGAPRKRRWQEGQAKGKVADESAGLASFVRGFRLGRRSEEASPDMATEGRQA